MGLYKRGNTWWYSFTLKGVRYRVSTNELIKIKANEVANNLYNKYKDIVINKKVDFSSIADKFLSLNYLNNLAKATKDSYKTTIKDALIFFEGKDFFNKANLYKYVEYLTTRELRPLKSNTLHNYFKILSTICKECQKIEFITENPIKKLDLSNYKMKHNRERILSKEERTLLLNKANADLRDYIEFAIETGLRKGEQLSLKWNNINFGNEYSTVKFYAKKVNRHIETLLSPIAVNILQKRLNMGLEKPFPFTSGMLHDKWTNLLKEIGIKEKENNLPTHNQLVWHSLRHTFITWLQDGSFDWLNAEVTSSHAQLWIGHTDIKTTMRYTHTDFKHLMKYIKQS